MYVIFTFFTKWPLRYRLHPLVFQYVLTRGYPDTPVPYLTYNRFAACEPKGSATFKEDFMKKKLFTLGFLTLALVALTLGSAWANTIRIGLMCPLTGSWASEGQDMKQIVELLPLKPTRPAASTAPRSKSWSRTTAAIRARQPWPPPV
jgi:hypothetical protein